MNFIFSVFDQDDSLDSEKEYASSTLNSLCSVSAPLKTPAPSDANKDDLKVALLEMVDELDLVIPLVTVTSRVIGADPCLLSK